MKYSVKLLLSFFLIIYPIYLQVYKLISGVQDGMASGEAPVSLISTNMQIGISSILVSASGNSVLDTPPTAAQSAYGAIQPKITLGPAGMAGCSFHSGYAHTSALQWSRNPFPGSSGVKSSLVRVLAVPQGAEVMVQGLLRSSRHLTSAVFSMPSVPAYTVALQFSSIQDFNFSAVNSRTVATTRGKTNFTLPACTVYNGVAYVPCIGCNLSSYTDYNVTYSCFDIKQLCQRSDFTRRLEDGVLEKAGSLVSDSEGVEGVNIRQRERFLQTSTGTRSSSTYGVLIQSISAELSSVLSANPFTLDYKHSTGVLAFTGCLGGLIIFMLLYFLRLDDREKLQKKYVKAESVAMARKLLEEDLKNGGKGDLSVAYQEHIRKLKKRFKSDLSIMETFQRAPSDGNIFSSPGTRGSSFTGQSSSSYFSRQSSNTDMSDVVLAAGDSSETRSDTDGTIETVFHRKQFQ